MADTATPTNADSTNAPAVTSPQNPTPALDKIKELIAGKDAQIADLKNQLDAAVQNGNVLNSKVSAMQDTINSLHNNLADYIAVETFLGIA